MRVGGGGLKEVMGESLLCFALFGFCFLAPFGFVYFFACLFFLDIKCSLVQMHTVLGLVSDDVHFSDFRISEVFLSQNHVSI